MPGDKYDRVCACLHTCKSYSTIEVPVHSVPLALYEVTVLQALIFETMMLIVLAFTKISIFRLVYNLGQ